MTSAPPDENTELDHLASERMKSGIALLSGSTPDALREAVRFFDEAIALRRKLPLAENAGFRYGLAAGWINRADALTRIGGAENLPEALNSYSAAIDLLKEPPADDDGSFVRRLAIAWMHRGNALQEQLPEPPLAEAMDCYKETIKVLSPLQRAPERDMILASAWINLGNASLRAAEGSQAASAAARESLALLAEIEVADMRAAEAGLKARHILCQGLTMSLGSNPDADSRMDWIDKLTDTIEDALRLVRHWEKQGVPVFRAPATQFFHLGALVYEQHQPHFLAEYLLDYLEPASEKFIPIPGQTWLAIAGESLSRTRNRLAQIDYKSLPMEEGVRRLEILKGVCEAEDRLQALRHA